VVVNSILILTAGFGEGHNAAARNLQEAITAVSPETPCVVNDVFRDAYGRLTRTVENGYITIINHFPSLWQTAFRIFDRTRLVEQHISWYGAAARRLTRLIAERRPSVIVSTYPGCNHLLNHLFRKRLKRPFTLVTIVTDSLTINSVWHRAHSDFFLVANDLTADVLANAGVPLQKIRIFGFPVPRIFASFNGTRSLPSPGERWRVLYVINSGRQLAPEITRRLLALEEVSLTVTVGRDHDLARELTILATENRRRLDIRGWTPEMPRLMAESHLLISKAGGATVQETLAARTPMIITQVVPGQEEGNARLIIAKEAGALATTPLEISATTHRAFADGAQEWHKWQRAAALLARPDAADETARFVLSLA
jgi:processive 1,2-diacylglycerol beta-glucosyltransferase